MDISQFTAPADAVISQYKSENSLDLSTISELLVTNERGETVALIDLVFEGGGAKGIAHIGALYALESLGIRCRKVAGTSAGAMVASLLGCHTGCITQEKSLELLRIITELDMRRFLDGGDDAQFAIDSAAGSGEKNGLVQAGKQAIGLLRNLGDVRRDLGMNPGKNFKDVVKSYLTDPAHSYRFTLQELTARQAEQARNLRAMNPHLSEDALLPDVQLITFDISHYRKATLPRDLDFYLNAFGHVDLLDLTRCSMSLPFIFAPAKITDIAATMPDNRRVEEALFIDGGIVENLPVSIFDNQDGSQPLCPTIGLMIDEGATPGRGKPIDSTRAYITQILLGLVHQQVDKIQGDIAAGRVMSIDATGPNGKTVSAIDFGMPDETKVHLFMNGVNAALKMMQQFDFASYPRKQSAKPMEAAA